MVKLLRPGRVVIITAGRFAGKKGVVLNAHESSKDKPFGYAVIGGVKLPPRHVHRRMKKTRIEKRCRVKTFVKAINFNHMIPTRYTVGGDIDVAAIGERAISTRKDIDEAKKLIKGISKKDQSELALQQNNLNQLRRSLRQELSAIFQEKFLNPVDEKTKKVSKDMIFLRKKLHF